MNVNGFTSRFPPGGTERTTDAAEVSHAPSPRDTCGRKWLDSWEEKGFPSLFHAPAWQRAPETRATFWWIEADEVPEGARSIPKFYGANCVALTFRRQRAARGARRPA